MPGRACAVALSVVALLGIVPPSGGAPAPGLGDRAAAAIAAPGPNLTIDPSDWWSIGGSTTTVAASWTAVPAGCGLSPEWYRWSIAAGGSEGLLDSTDGPTVNFTANSAASGVTDLVAEAAALLVCGANESSVFRIANSTLHVDAAMSLRAIRLAAPPRGDPGSAVIDGTLTGGEPPFELTVDGGDGNSTSAPVAADGNFSIVGRAGAAPVAPSVVATDAAGLIARATVEENSTGSGNFDVTIVPSTYVADAGVPVAFHVASNGPGNWSMFTACTGPVASPDLARASPAQTFSCTFSFPGVANISVVAVQDHSPYSVSYAQILEPVEPRFAVVAEPTVAPGEVGRTSYVPFDLTGGVPPYRLSWRFVGNGSASTAVVGQDGTFLAPATPSVAGAEEVVVNATDALGLPAAGASGSITVDGPLSAQVVDRGEPVPGGTALILSGSAVAGAPPYDWTVVDTAPLTNETSAGGALGAAGSFAWNGTARAEGPQGATLVIVDAAGAIAPRAVTVDAVPRLAVTLVTAADGAGRWSAAVEIAGGVPPYEAFVNATGAISWNRSGLERGPWNFTVDAGAAGNLTVRLVVVDRLGIVARASAFVTVKAAPPAPAAGAALDTVPAVVVLVGIAAAAAFWWRRRSRPPAASTAVDTVAVLRAILEPADGADRAVVELLAEEHGVPIAEVRSTLDRLIGDGTVIAERGPDGEEVLAWRGAP